ncbi:MAG: 50S ribosomal protein L23 [Candidatus Altiarchaeota archaeon]
MQPDEILLYPLMGEKATTLRERENKLTFVINKKATRKEVKEAVEKLYNVKVLKVNIIISPNGEKKAHVKLSKEFSAEEIASKFGVI